jgi:hypothetical protein
MTEAISLPGFPQQLIQEDFQLADEWRGYGMQEHVLLSYGDERNHVDPWTLVDERHAARSLAAAERAVEFSRRCRSLLFPDC